MRYERIDRPLTDHRLMARHGENRSDTEVPTPESSQARLAAEAAFTQRPITLVANAGPQVVVVKRKKAIVPAGKGDPIETEFHEPMKEARTPRVFRVDSPVVGSGPAVEVSEQPPAVGASPDFNASVGVGALPAQVVQIKRRRRRIPRAEVTIIRPAAPSGPVTSDPPAGRPAEMLLLQELRLLEPCFAALRAAQDFDFGIATSGRGAPSRYQALKAQIKKLEQRAEAARKAEAARAARWIKRAIAAYGLRASDLGL
jgi:hypothetical protein